MRCFPPLLSSRLAFVCGAVLWLAPSLHAGWAAPDGFFEKEKIERKEVAPGVVWIAASGERSGKPLRTHLLAIDLKKSGVKLQNLLGQRQFKADSRQRVPRSTVSQLAQAGGALAAINTAFFDIKATQSPSGFLLHKGEVLREPQRGRPSLLYLEDGTLRIGDVELQASVRHDDKAYPLAAINSPYFPSGKFALYRSPWRGTPEDASKPKEEPSAEPVTRIVLEAPPVLTSKEVEGRVKAVATDAVPLNAGETMLVFKGALPFEPKVGASLLLSAEWQVQGESLPTAPRAEEAFSGGPLLVRDGQSMAKKTKHWVLRHPRSAVGIDKAGERLVLVAVEGRSDESAGIGLAELADYFLHLECDAALNFDGGGSTALGAVVDGEWRVFNVTSDGPERFVPAGLGVMLPKQTEGAAGAK